MSPDATYAIMTDESNTLDERAVAATDLLVWAAWRGDWQTIRTSAWTMTEIADYARGRIFAALDRLAELEGT
jgi:hypothetical protein